MEQLRQHVKYNKWFLKFALLHNIFSFSNFQVPRGGPMRFLFQWATSHTPTVLKVTQLVNF